MRAVLIPFISGLDCYTPVEAIAEGMRVLIPFISGLDCYSDVNQFYHHYGLNPFYFRAGLLRVVRGKGLDLPGLNPFYFRAGLLPRGWGMQDKLLGLNPFYFRAGLLPPDCARSSKPPPCLNPFYFRAGLLPDRAGDVPARMVLIPFISGLDCYCGTSTSSCKSMAWRARSGFSGECAGLCRSV